MNIASATADHQLFRLVTCVTTTFGGCFTLATSSLRCGRLMSSGTGFRYGETRVTLDMLGSRVCILGGIMRVRVASFVVQKAAKIFGKRPPAVGPRQQNGKFPGHR